MILNIHQGSNEASDRVDRQERDAAASDLQGHPAICHPSELKQVDFSVIICQMRIIIVSSPPTSSRTLDNLYKVLGNLPDAK